VPGEPQDDRTLFGHFVRGLGESTRTNSLAYGYSLALTGAYGVLNEIIGTPHFPQVLLFVVGAAFTFSIANAAVTRGYRQRVEGEPPIVLAFGASFGFLSIAAALGAAALVGWLVPDWVGWLLGGFVASSVYLLGSALELVLARAVRAVVGREHLEER
jgi:drug/metabolite transporter (DMT)-like permease